MPQTMEEHLDELEDDASEDHASISSFEDDQVSDCCRYENNGQLFEINDAVS